MILEDETFSLPLATEARIRIAGKELSFSNAKKIPRWDPLAY